MSKKPRLDTDQVASDLSESAFFHPTSPQTGKTTSIQVDKPTKHLVEKYTTHLQPTTIKAVKRYAVEHDMKDYEVVQQALDTYLERYKETTSLPDPTVPVERPTPKAQGAISTHQAGLSIPDGWVALDAVIEQHTISMDGRAAARLKKKATREITTTKRIQAQFGAWTHEGHTVHYIILSDLGEFYEVMKTHPDFVRCGQCPHNAPPTN